MAESSTFSADAVASAPLVEQAIDLARRWANEVTAGEGETSRGRIAASLQAPDGARFSRSFVDAVIRPESLSTAASGLHRIAPVVPESLPWFVRGAVRAGGALAPVLPAPVVPLARRALREMIGSLVVDARPAKLGPAIARLQGSGARLRLTPLGEAVLGDAEAQRRLDSIRDVILRDDVDDVSFAVSDVFSHLSMWAFEDMVDEIAERVLPLYVTAASGPSTVITLDIEQYRDLDLTISVFTSVLEDARLQGVSAGITMPASLPDALPALQELAAWARQRVEQGGAPIRVRLVKGANLAVERVEARLHGWTPASYDATLDVDANYVRCLDWLLRSEHSDSVGVDAAGRDLPSIAYAWVLAGERGVRDQLRVELRAGASTAQVQAVSREVGDVWMPVPVVAPDEFVVALGHLMRRLDDPTTPEAFAEAVRRSASPSLATGARRARRARSQAPAEQNPVAATPADDEGLTQAVLGISRGSDAVDDEYVDTAVYSVREGDVDAESAGIAGLTITADSDPLLPETREWAREIRARIADSTLGMAAPDIEPGADSPTWGLRPAAERADLLLRAAAAIEARRGDLIEVAASEAGKLLAEADTEVSDSVDIARYYAARARELEAISGAVFEPATVTTVDARWNNSLATLTGDVTAALAAGSGVMLKAEPRTSRCAAVIAECLWQAGVPRDALIVVDVDITTEAKAGGKNTLIVMPSADLDLAASDLVRSAFRHAGQSGSAVSLAIVVGPVGHSQRFTKQLRDAVESVRVGWPADPKAEVGPLIDRPDGARTWALETLEDDERWLVQPAPLDAGETGRLWGPGVRIGVRSGSRFSREEFFAPVLGLVHASTLERAIAMQNELSGGRIAGLHTQEPQDLALWLDQVHAAELYVNRGTPRQRAGNPNRLVALGRWRAQPMGALSSTLHLRGLDDRITALIEAAQPSLDFESFEWLRRAALSDALAWDREFGRVRDTAQLGVERNLLRYRRVPVEVRVASGAPLRELLRVVIGAVRAGSPLVLSLAEGLPAAVRQELSQLRAAIYLETDAEWLERGLRHAWGEGEEGQARAERVRLVGGEDAVADLRAGLAALDLPDGAVRDGAVTSAGRIELLTFVREQSISITAHRGGVLDEWSAAVI